jgi:hypothetical protein
MFNIFLESLHTFSDVHTFDLAIICDFNAKKDIKNNALLKDFNSFYINVPIDKELKFALLRKFDIIKFKKFNDYSKIMYIDIDIIVQGNILDVFNKVTNIKNNTLYATKEGDLEGKFWYMNNTYKNGNIEKMRTENIHSFNSGMFLFKPSDEMKTHFKNVKKFALDFYKNQQEKSNSFFDQSHLNYYFNINRLSNTNYMNDIYQMFPDTNKYYPKKILLHIAGIGRYKEKSKIMRTYLDFIKTKKIKIKK